MVGVAAILALAAVAVPWMAAPRGHAAGGVSESPSTTPEPTLAPPPSATPVRLAHAQKWFLSFDYPSDWTVTDRNITAATNGLNSQSQAQGNPSVFGFLGNGTASEECVPNPPVLLYTCTTTWSLGPGTVAFRFEIAPPWPYHTDSAWTAQRAVTGTDIPGAEALTIDGLPARFAKSTTDAIPFSTEMVSGATEVLWWGLTSQLQFQFGYSIVAAIKGPNVAELEAQAKAFVAGIHYLPETAMLPTDPVALDQVRQAALETALADQKRTMAANKDQNHAWDCFPTVVGESRKATITQTPSTNPLTKPLPVTCTVESMVPTVMQGWTVTFSQAWDAGQDYPAGKATVVMQMTGDGKMTWQWGTPTTGTIELPAYPHQGRSSYPG
jgi:hypothetical protein